METTASLGTVTCAITHLNGRSIKNLMERAPLINFFPAVHGHVGENVAQRMRNIRVGLAVTCEQGDS